MVPMLLTPPTAKSESVAVVELDERVSVRKLTKCGTFAPNIAVRSRPTLRNSPACGRVKPLLSMNGQVTGSGPVFTNRYVDPAGGLTGTRLPEVSEPVQR